MVDFNMINTILSQAMNEDARLSFKSYDRFFPTKIHCQKVAWAILWLYLCRERHGETKIVSLLMSSSRHTQTNGVC